MERWFFYFKPLRTRAAAPKSLSPGKCLSLSGAARLLAVFGLDAYFGWGCHTCGRVPLRSPACAPSLTPTRQSVRGSAVFAHRRAERPRTHFATGGKRAPGRRPAPDPCMTSPSRLFPSNPCRIERTATLTDPAPSPLWSASEAHVPPSEGIAEFVAVPNERH